MTLRCWTLGFLGLFSASCLSSSEAALTVDLLQGADVWQVPDRVSRCPVHRKTQPMTAADGRGVTFVPYNENFQQWGRGNPFSISEIPVLTGGLDGFEGIHLNFTSTGIKEWKLRLYDGTDSSRFIHVISYSEQDDNGDLAEKPGSSVTWISNNGMHSMIIPFTRFQGEILRPGGIRRCNSHEKCWTINTASISTIGVMLPYGEKDSQLTLHGLDAIVASAEAPMPGSSAAEWQDHQTESLLAQPDIIMTTSIPNQAESYYQPQPDSVLTTSILNQAVTTTSIQNQAEDYYSSRPDLEDGTSISHACLRVPMRWLWFATMCMSLWHLWA